MHASPPPLALIFGPFDPSGSSSLPADVVTCAQLGCHALSAVTGLQVRDTATTESIQPVSPELIDDQARCVLEDMTVQAIKAGTLYTTEAISVLAQIAADYSHVPLLLHLTRLPDETLLEDTDTEDLLLATFELLLPQTDIVMVDRLLLEQWHSQGLLAASDAADPIQALLEYGAGWTLATGITHHSGQNGLLLQGQQGETVSLQWPALPARPTDADGPLACAITTGLARGLQVPDAVRAAAEAAVSITSRQFRPGMGQRLINRCAP
ncbi:bifunctional hydroxymethylpyrimidine kinase/phosphomethylpyrimidine kinase [Paracandidimonas lactea]|uniref:bifunctional hydroxymethylpyrimidine kinase/phosphomethylpyrimidine kinase n=1 Tax=Paracandidimonas lactea TaxID=2895524 RepID=UPI001F1D5E28